MNGKTTAGLIVAALLMSAVAQAQSVYRVVDKDGNVSYTDRPPATVTDDKAVDRMKVQIRLTDPALIAASREETLKQAKADGTAADIRERQEAEDKAEANRAEEQRAANCELAKQRMKSYSEARRLFRELDNGEREYLTNEEIDSTRAEAARSVDEWCGG